VAAPPLPEIKEEDAADRIAALYDDLRAVIGVPIVNLIFRHMATVSGCLDWTWETLRPLYISGEIPKAADTLTADILPGHMADLTKPIALAQLNEEDIGAIDQVLNSYGRANPMNAVGLQVIHYVLEGTPRTAVKEHAPPLSDGVLLTPSGLKDLLPMVDPTSAAESVKSALNRLARQIHGGDTGVIPSLYRHFGAWPVFLEALEAALEPALSGGIEDAAQGMLAQSKAVAHELYLNLRLPKQPPNSQSIDALKKLIEQFPVNICRMTVLATLLKRGLPQERCDSTEA
jgi:hypothetical protein